MCHPSSRSHWPLCGKHAQVARASDWFSKCHRTKKIQMHSPMTLTYEDICDLHGVNPSFGILCAIIPRGHAIHFHMNARWNVDLHKRVFSLCGSSLSNDTKYTDEYCQRSRGSFHPTQNFHFTSAPTEERVGLVSVTRSNRSPSDAVPR